MSLMFREKRRRGPGRGSWNAKAVFPRSERERRLRVLDRRIQDAETRLLTYTQAYQLVHGAPATYGTIRHLRRLQELAQRWEREVRDLRRTRRVLGRGLAQRPAP